MIKNHLIIAWRQITGHSLYSLIKISGLAIGVCACILIYLVTRHEFSYDRSHPDKERIFHVGSKRPSWDFISSRVPPAMPDAIKREVAGVEEVAAFYPYQATVTIPGKGGENRQYPLSVPGSDWSGLIITDRHYFEIFPYTWLAGSPAGSLSYPNAVVLCASKARTYFGDLPFDQVVGKEMRYNDSLIVHVSGIVRDWDQNTDFPFTEFISFSTIGSSWLKNTIHPDSWVPAWGSPDVWTLVRLNKDAAPARVTAQLNALLGRRMPPDQPMGKLQATLQPLPDLHFDTKYSHDDIRKAYLPALYGSMGIGLLILIIAVINFINLSVAQVSQRTKEIGVRKVLGSGRKNLLVQFLTETFLLTLFTTSLAVLLVSPAMRVFHDYIPYGVSFHLSDPYTILFLLSITLFTTLASGYYPARMVSAYSTVSGLKGAGMPQGSRNWWLRKGFIVFQFTIALVFIMGTMLITRQIKYMLHTDLGSRSDAIISLNVWRKDTSRLHVLEERIRALSGVARVIRQSNAPMGWMHRGAELKYKGGGALPRIVSVDYGNENYIPFYELRLLAGRNLQHSDSLLEFVVNETFAKAMGCRQPADAVGKFLYGETAGAERAYPIVGVVADYHEESFHEPIKPVAIGHSPEAEHSLAIQLAMAGKDPVQVKGTLNAIEAIWKEIGAVQPISYSFIDDSIASFYEQEIKTSQLMNIVMAVSIFISGMGLFGLSMFAAGKRTKEIGIRKVLGASVIDILALLNREFVGLVVIAIVLASPLAWYFMHRWLEDYAFRVPVSGWIFVIAGACAIGIALLTVSVHAVRAAMANPVKSLQEE